MEDEEVLGGQSPSEPKETSLSGSGDKSHEEQSVTSEDSEYDMDMEEETPDTTIKKSSGKKPKKGITVRARINSIAAEIDQPEQPNVETRKRKAGFGTGTEAEM